MRLFYKVSDKKLLRDRNELFKEAGIPALEKCKFVSRPFKNSWYGEYYSGIQGYIYEFGRVENEDVLEIVRVYISSGDKYIKIYINVFKIMHKLNLISELNSYDGLKFGIPPNNLTNMRLRSEDYKGPPLFYMFFLPQHKVGTYYTKSGYGIEIQKLKKLIKSDMENIDGFLKRWHELHKPNVTDLEGNIMPTGYESSRRVL